MNFVKLLRAGGCFSISPIKRLLLIIPIDTGRKLNVHTSWTSWTSSERLMYVQFTSCLGDVKPVDVNMYNYEQMIAKYEIIVSAVSRYFLHDNIFKTAFYVNMC